MEALRHRITGLEQTVVDLTGQITEHLDAARAANREMITRLNTAAQPPLLVGTGRRTPTDVEKATLGDFAAKLPHILG